MKIEVQSHAYDPGEHALAFARRRIKAVFAGRSDEIAFVSARLTAVDEPRGGRDKSCRVEVGFGGRVKVVAEVMDSDPYVAVHRAVDRAGWIAARRLQRARRATGSMTVVERHLAGHGEPHWAA